MLWFRTANLTSARIVINYLTNNVTKDHVAEIFGIYGKINSIEIVTPEKSSGRILYQRMMVEYETASEAHKATKYMNGGMLFVSLNSLCKVQKVNTYFAAINIVNP